MCKESGRIWKGCRWMIDHVSRSGYMYCAYIGERAAVNAERRVGMYKSNHGGEAEDAEDAAAAVGCICW